MLPAVTSRSAWLAPKPVRLINPVLWSDAAVTSSDAERVALPMRREPLLVSAPPMLRTVPPSPPLPSTRRRPVLVRKVATVFIPADSKERSDESVIEFTAPIEAEATGAPVAITTSEFRPGMPDGLQLSESFQSELIAPVHVDLLMIFPPKD
jgi:hypothetical protein